MNGFKTSDTLIFDLDGTLIDTALFITPVYKKCFKIQTEKYGKKFNNSDIKYVLGLIGDKRPQFIAGLNKRYGKELTTSLLQCVDREYYTQNTIGKINGFYKGVPETLNLLKSNDWKMAICTNSPTHYFQLIRDFYQLDKYFDAMYWVGKYPNKSKAWMIKKILAELKTTSAIVIGDRYHDFEAAKANKLISIGCLYGFGPEDIKKADYTIKDITELPTLLHSISKKSNYL